MSLLTLPNGADTGFRLELWDAFGNRFTAHVYGAGRSGWLLARRKWFGDVQSMGPERLARGKWRELLGLIKQVGFWELPEKLPESPDLVMDDGEWLFLAGRIGNRYHHIQRDGAGGRLFQVQRFITRLSGLFPEPRPSHPTEGLALDAQPTPCPEGAAQQSLECPPIPPQVESTSPSRGEV